MPALAITIDYLALKAEYLKLHGKYSGSFLDTILPEDLAALDLHPPTQVWLIDWMQARVMCYWKVTGDKGVRNQLHPA